MSRFEEIEREHGRPMSEILIDAYEVYGSGNRVAAALDIDQATLSRWLLKLQLQQVARLVPARPYQSVLNPAGAMALPGFEES